MEGGFPDEDATKQVVGDVFELGPGAKLGEYEIVEPLGRGGMGVVFAAVHPTIGKQAAIKVIKKELSNPYNVERFIDEARIVNAIGHPNIVDIFAFGEMPDGRCYYVMEQLIGETLDARIDRGGLTIEETCTLLKPLVRALDAAHKKGVIHRDVKPDNVFLVEHPGDRPTVKLLDFGIAKLANTEHRVSQTATGAIVGTPQYIAPEQAKGYAMDHRVDVYALGGIAFEMLTGRPPFEADNAAEMVAKHLMEKPVAPSTVVPRIPAELDSIVLAMLSKDPAGRPELGSVAAVLDIVLERIASGDDRGSLEPFEVPLDEQETSLEQNRKSPGSAPRPAMTALPSAVIDDELDDPPSGAHTAVEPVVTPNPTMTEQEVAEPVTGSAARWPWALVAIVLIAGAGVGSYFVVRSLGAKPSTTVASVLPDAALAAEDLDVASAAITPIEDLAPSALADAGVAPSDAAPAVIAPPRDAGLPERPRVTWATMTIEVPNAKSATIKIDGATFKSRVVRRYVAGKDYVVIVSAPGRKTQRFTVRLTAKGYTRTVKLEDDLMRPEDVE